MDKEADGQREGESTRVWYFAYGSNMSPITLGRRRLRPSESVAGVLVGYRLLFDHVGVPFFEPSFANIVPEKGCCVHGVLHSLTASEWQRVLASEGGGGYTEGYFPVEVEVTTYDNRRIKALTLESSKGGRHAVDSPHTWPSKRYVGLLLDGAGHYRIDPDYVAEYITAQPVCRTSQVLRLVVIALMACIVVPIFVPYYVAMRLGASTRYFHVLAAHLKALVWGLHNVTPALTLVAFAVLAGGVCYSTFLLGSLIFTLIASFAAALGLPI